MDISAIALQALQRADAQANQAASGIASMGATSSPSQSLDSADFTAEVLSLISAENQTAVNIATLNAAEQIQQNTISLIA